MTPRRAPVRPRVILPGGGGAFTLDAVLPAPGNLSWRAVIAIIGGPGQGRSTALEHAAFLLAPDPRIRYLDDPSWKDYQVARSQGPVVYTAREPLEEVDLLLRLTAWGDDELIELALAREGSAAKTALRTLLALPDREGVLRLPGLAADLMTALAEAGPDAPGPRSAILAAFNLVARHLTPVAVGRLLGRAFDRATGFPDERLPEVQRPAWAGRFLADPRTEGSLAAVHAISTLYKRPRAVLSRPWPGALRARVAERIAGSPQLRAAVEHVLGGETPDLEPTAASLLVAAVAGWRPGPEVRLRTLTRADLAGVRWAGVELPGVQAPGAKLDRADLAGANLQGANLSHADLASARLSGANLAGAELSGAMARQVDLSDVNARDLKAAEACFECADASRARLEGALLLTCNLTGARLIRANLTGAHLTGGVCEDADLSGAVLERASLNALDLRSARLVGVRFRGAVLRSCRLDGQTLELADFSGGSLQDCDLTAANLRHADLRGTGLTGCGLAHVDLEGADLREAVFRECSFHAGSSRSGLVGSPLACEGSRTGFYTDEATAEAFKDPAEIRKANLCGCDLRGADLGRMDFYLVDVRGARYSTEQAAWLRACGAILG